MGLTRRLNRKKDLLSRYAWKIQKSDEDQLDICEGYHKDDYSYYDKERISVKMNNGKTVSGMVYVMDKKKDFGIPSKRYYDTVRQGYLECGLDTTILDKAVDKSIDLAQQRMAQGGMRMW